MSIDHDNPETGLERQHIQPRPAPRCYSRQAMSQAIQEPRTRADANAILIALSVVTCAVAFLLASGGWSF
jgi:hypothetical protein